MQAKFFYGADNVLDIRGNVDTRMQKLSDNQFDCIILAEQGLRRLGIYKNDLNCFVRFSYLQWDKVLICLQYRAEDEETGKIISTIFDNNNLLDNVNAYIEMAEAQQFVSALGADCNSAIAIQVDDATDWGNCRGLMLQAEIANGKISFIRVASHDENGNILKKEYATMKEFPHAGELK